MVSSKVFSEQIQGRLLFLIDRVNRKTGKAFLNRGMLLF